ncbi:MAG: pseudouridine synthase [Bacteroidales bacterium]
MTSNHNTDRPYKKGKPVSKNNASMNKSRGESKSENPGRRDSGKDSGPKRSYPRKDSDHEEPKKRFSSSSPRRDEPGEPTRYPGKNRAADSGERSGREKREFPRKDYPASKPESGRRERPGSRPESREHTGDRKREYPSKERTASDRPSHQGGDRSERFHKKERPSSDRPSFPRDEKSGRFQKRERPSSERPAGIREERSERFPKRERPSSDRPSGPREEKSERFSERERPSSERPAYSRDAKSGRFQKRERPSRDRSESTYNPERRPETMRSDAPVRLNKYIAHAGICSRREADTLIETGAISINGVIVTELGTKVKPGDIVRYGDTRLVNERKVYILLNKPKDYITTSEDPQGRKTVLDLVYRACRERVYPVGRLDRNTTGLLLFTNDGEMAKKLTHPKHGVNKIYHVHLDKPLTKADLEQVAKGVELEDVTVVPDAVSYIEGESKKEVGIQIHSGQNRIVRRIFEKLGYDVQKLDRVAFAGLTKKDLPRGKWRFLSEKEVSFLKMLK